MPKTLWELAGVYFLIHAVLETNLPRDYRQAGQWALACIYYGLSAWCFGLFHK